MLYNETPRSAWTVSEANHTVRSYTLKTSLLYTRCCYIAHYPVRSTTQIAVHITSPPPRGRPVHSNTNSASPGSILATQQLRATTKSLTFPPLSIARYSFIQLSELERQWRERKCPIFETVAKGDSNPGSLDCESCIVPLSYHRVI